MTFRIALPATLLTVLMASVGTAASGAPHELAADPKLAAPPEAAPPPELAAPPEAAPGPGLAPPGTYRDEAGSPTHFELEYQRQARLPEPHHLRSFAEMGVGLGAGAIVYWLMMEKNAPDWDDPRLVQRFDGTAWRFDNNSLPVNFILHPGVGGLAYAFARANHHGVATSAGYSFLTSFIWEFAFEFKEMVSVNDVLATPAAGVPLGEFFHKLGLYLDSAEEPGPLLQTLQWTLGAGVQLDHALDETSRPQPGWRDSLGLTSSIWHDIEADYELHAARSVGPEEYLMHRLGLRCKLVTLPGYRRPGHLGRAFYRADFASMGVRAEASGRGGGAEVTAETLLFGYHLQRLRGVLSPTHGYALTAAASVAYRFFESNANGLGATLDERYAPEPGVRHNTHRYNEQFSVAHLPGPALDWYVLAPGIRLEVGTRVHPDFAGVGGLAYGDWANANPSERGKAILLKQGYFYAWGGSGEFLGSLELGPLRVAGTVFYGRYRSQDGLERQPEKMTIDVPAGAGVLGYRASLRLKPPELPLELGLSAEMRRWDSWVGAHRRSTRMLSRGLHLSTTF